MTGFAGIANLSIGTIVKMVYDGKLRHVRLEEKPVFEVQNGLPYVKVYDLDKQGFRSFTLDKITEVV